MHKDRRKFMRFDIPLAVEFKPSIESDFNSKGTTVNFSRSGLCFETNENGCDFSDLMELKVTLPKKDKYISVKGELAWKTKTDNSGCLVGIRFKQIDSEAKNDILDHAYDSWLLNFRR